MTESDASVLTLDARTAKAVFGEFDSYAKTIEKSFNVSLIQRESGLKIIGSAANITAASSLINKLAETYSKQGALTEQTVNYQIAMALENRLDAVSEADRDIISYTIMGKPIKPKTIGQKEYVDLIRNKMIVFGIGPAGTGKTYLAMAMAIKAFKADEVSRIILTRPAIEAGEKLGFLPGDMQSKVDPYLRPLYDALYQIMGAETFQRNMEKGLIEVAPLAYMRGRTLDNAFIILDEAQNTTPAQMKMFLTRIGFGSKAIITGDITQKDLPEGTVSGLDTALKVLSGIDEIGISRLTSLDVVRHPLVQKIVNAYEEYEKKESRKKLPEKTPKGTGHANAGRPRSSKR
jgi:phosphate starvation-inducible PhoH-like protein